MGKQGADEVAELLIAELAHYEYEARGPDVPRRRLGALWDVHGPGVWTPIPPPIGSARLARRRDLPRLRARQKHVGMPIRQVDDRLLAFTRERLSGHILGPRLRARRLIELNAHH